MTLTGRAVRWACGANKKNRRDTLRAIAIVTGGSGFHEFVVGIVKNCAPGHESPSDIRDHATVWLKSREMERRGTHQPLHLYFDRNGMYEGHRLYAEKDDDKPSSSCIIL